MCALITTIDYTRRWYQLMPVKHGSHKGNFYAVLDREDMNRSGVFPNWLDAEYVKKSASGYGKYGTKQDCIEGALEELDTMIKHYNLICMKKLGNK